MSVTSCTRIPVDPAPRPGNAAIRRRYPVDLAHWLWHPEWQAGARSVVCFELKHACAEAETLEFDMTADQRYVLSVDGEAVARGPDRAELGGWSFHRYRLTLPAGNHVLSVLAWWLPEEERPVAQVTARPGFALVGLDGAADMLSTAAAPWKVRCLNGWNVLPRGKRLTYHVIGAGFEIDGEAADGPLVDPVVVARGGDNPGGVPFTPWRCEPSPLPEQAVSGFSGGRVRAVQEGNGARLKKENGAGAFEGLPWGEPVSVPAGSVVQVFWDFEDYVCGYPRLRLRGGKGSVVEMEWAESLYEDEAPDAHTPKGNRGACEGKTWLGFGDRVTHPGGGKTYEPLWWRSGRWLRLKVMTAGEPLDILDARPLRTGHPFEPRWAFSCDEDMAGPLALCENALRNCVHETFVDCPYYEQLQYGGDTRVQALVWLAVTGDPRPVKRCLQVFDRSRWFNGFVAERCPSSPVQMSATYSLIQPLLLRDFMLWADDPAFVKQMLPGTRSALEHAVACIDGGGLPSLLPGWLFVDWVKREDWQFGNPRGLGLDLNAPVALHLPLALSAAAEVEDGLGDPDVARRWRRVGKQVFGRIVDTFYDEGRGLFADTVDREMWSEHAQALALACPWLDDDLRPGLLDALGDPPADFARASIYFSYYVHEALLVGRRADVVWERFDFWRALEENGFKTTVEAPEPARSDCHAWGAHPLFHCLTGIAGIRPGAPGFATARVAPQFGRLAELSAEVPTPHGTIRAAFSLRNGRLAGSIETPVPAELVWDGTSTNLEPGRHEL